MVGVKIVSKVVLIDRLTGEEALDALDATLFGGAPTGCRRMGVFLADDRDDAIEASGLGPQQPLQRGAAQSGVLFRLLDQEVAEQ
jgi:hypothetical protein